MASVPCSAGPFDQLRGTKASTRVARDRCNPCRCLAPRDLGTRSWGGTRRAEEAACDSHANGNGHNGKVILFDWSASDAGHIEFLLWIGGRTSHCGSRCNRCSRPLVANRLFPSFLGSVKEGSFKFFLLVGLRRCWKEQRSGLLGPRGVLATFV